MKHCPHCKIDVNTERKMCPLCFHVLEEKDEVKTYQEYPKYHEHHKPNEVFLRIALYILLVGIIASTIVNIVQMANSGTFGDIGSWWSLMVDGAAIYTYSFIITMFKSRRNLSVRFLRHLFLISAFMICVNIVANRNELWSLDYLVPFFISLTMLTLIMMVFIKPKLYRDYLVTLIWLSIISFIPIILCATTRFVNVWWPSIVSCSIGGLILLGMFVFPRKATREEMQKRFHI